MRAFYVKTRFNNTINISKIITVHYYEFDSNFSYDGESHDFWEMVYIDKGKVEISTDNGIFILGQEEIFFHKPNEFHSIKAYDSSPNFFVVSFECNSPQMANFENYHTKLSKTLKPIISSIITESNHTYAIPKNDINLKKLKIRDSSEIGGEQLVKIYLEQLFIIMLRDILKKETRVFPSKELLENHLVSLIKNYINLNLKNPFTLKDVCRNLNYGKSYLCKVFHTYTGYSIMNYVTEEKIKLAKQLIRENNLNITEISNELSFDNPQYFSRVFKRVTSLTPTEFKLSLNI